MDPFEHLQGLAGNVINTRRVTLTTIMEVDEKLNDVAVSTNIVQGAGDIASITGSLCTVFAAGLSLAGAPIASTLLNAGSFITKTGVVASSAGNLTEKGFSLLYLNDVQRILEADKRASSALLQDWMPYSRNLDTNVRALFGDSLGSPSWLKIATILPELVNFSKAGSAQINHYKDLFSAPSGKFARAIFEDSDRVQECLERFFNKAASSPLFSTELRNVLLGIQLCVGIQGIGEDVVKWGSGEGASVSLPATSMILQPTPGVVMSCCFLETVNIAASVLSLMSVNEVLTTGRSRYSLALNELKTNLKLELELLERVFNQ